MLSWAVRSHTQVLLAALCLHLCSSLPLSRLTLFLFMVPSLSLTHTHTHTRSHALSLSLSLFLFLSLPLPRSAPKTCCTVQRSSPDCCRQLNKCRDDKDTRSFKCKEALTGCQGVEGPQAYGAFEYKFQQTRAFLSRKAGAMDRAAARGGAGRRTSLPVR